ncbi:hypothetical protein BS78_01G255300 [Paspalum vaginatum]|nr:hypothetical protein BS78_01G255300 [Paspalum vaginatum]KAJ1295863.1 hypothetical protein BS78_01G255300 [Paspalum vaginatum]
MSSLKRYITKKLHVARAQRHGAPPMVRHDYRANIVNWDTKVTEDILGLPPYAAFKNSLTPIITPSCDIQTCYFNKKIGVCRADALTASKEAIPISGNFVVPHLGPNGTHYCIYFLTMHTYLYSQAPPDNNKIPSDCLSTEGNDHLNHVANNACDESLYEIEYGVDRDMAHETWRESFRRENAYKTGWDPMSLYLMDMTQVTALNHNAHLYTFIHNDPPYNQCQIADLQGENGWESDRSSAGNPIEAGTYDELWLQKPSPSSNLCKACVLQYLLMEALLKFQHKQPSYHT